MYENLEKRLDGSYTFTKNGYPYNCPNIGEWLEEYAEVHAWALANPSEVTQEVAIDLPPPPSLHEQALQIQLTKREFLKLVIGLTADMTHPETGQSLAITLAAIEAYVAGADDAIRLEWTYANHIERAHPMLDVVSASFGISAEMLDIMFVNKDALLYKIDNGLPLHEEAVAE